MSIRTHENWQLSTVGATNVPLLQNWQTKRININIINAITNVMNALAVPMIQAWLFWCNAERKIKTWRVTVQQYQKIHLTLDETFWGSRKM